MTKPSLVSRIKGLFGISWGVPGPTVLNAREWLLDLPDAPGGTLEWPYAQSAVVQTAVRNAAEDAASVEWELFVAGGEDPLEEHPVHDLWRRPNPAMYGSDLWVASYIYFKLLGECFWYYPDLTIGDAGGPKATQRNTGDLVLPNPKSIAVKHRDGEIEYYQRVDGRDVKLDASRVTHFRRFNPYDDRRGLSELSSVQVELEADYAAARWNRNLFSEQGGVPAGIIKPKADSVVHQEDRENFERRWNTTHASKRRAGILPPGWDWQDVSRTQQEMEFRALREYGRELALGVSGMPPFLAGVLDKANYANARAQKDVYWLGTISRMLRYFEEKLNYDFLPKIGQTGIKAFANWEAVRALSDNLGERFDVAQKMFAMGFTRRQINDRLELGLDVDENEDADVGYLPFSLAPIGALDAVRAPVAGEVTGEDSDEDEETESRGLGRTRLLKATDLEEAQRIIRWRSVTWGASDIEARFGSTIRRHIRGIRDEVLGNIDGIKGWMISRPRIVGKADPITFLFDLLKWQRLLQEATKPLHTAAIKRGADVVASEIGVQIAFNLENPVVVGKIAELTGKITRIDETIERLLRDALAEKLQAGASIGEMSKTVREVMDVAASRARTIARTETGFAYNTGRNEGMKQAGIQYHQWIAARDEAVRDHHREEDGQIAAIGEPFPTTKLLYPLDPSGAASEVINCRCVAIPVLRVA